jgi:hypothetical protein
MASPQASAHSGRLPPCPYRRPRADHGYVCEAGDGVIVSDDDCLICSIPAALAHKDACLYLVPLRQEDKACYACSWFFDSAPRPVENDWRDLCFCPYWFPRPEEMQLADVVVGRRVHYLQVLRGETTRGRERMPSDSRARCTVGPWQRVVQRWRSIQIRLGVARHATKNARNG